MTISFPVLIRGDLVLEDRVAPGGAVAVDGERIAGVFPDGADVSGRVEHDFRGRYVLPGLVDTHVHTRSTATEGIQRATSAAAAGGVTTLVDMPYDTPDPVTGVRRLREKIAEIEAESIVDAGLYGTMAKTDGPDALAELLAEGVCAFKFSTYETDAHRFPRILDGDLLLAFEALAPSGVPIVIHAEQQEIVDSRLARALAAGEDGAAAHGWSRPVVSETVAASRVLELALWTGARLHLAHVTHPHGFRLIEWYRGLGAAVSGETCVHYLALCDEDDVHRHRALAKVNPPIRDAEAREGLWRDLEAGRIASISTDHAPWPRERKEGPLLRAASGMPGLETFLPVLWTEARRRGVPIWQAVGFATWRPAAIFGLGDRKGRLRAGFDADLAIFDARARWRFDASRSHSSADWSPFAGRDLDGQVEATFVRGRQVAAAGRVLIEPGYGRWLRRSANAAARAGS